MVERKLTITDVLRPVIKIGLIGFGAALFGGASITLRDHRELVHRSVKNSSFLQKIFDFEQRTLGVDPRFWAAVHRIHHQMTDVNLAPFARIARRYDWGINNPDKVEGVEVPDSFPLLDPEVESFTLPEVVQIGNLAREFYLQRLGDRYREPETYTAEESIAVFHRTTPAYWYSNKEHTDGFTQEDMEDILGGDPHSPVRFPVANGIRTELFHFPKVNEGAAALFRAHPELLPEDLQSADGKYRKYGKPDIALGFGIAALAVLLARHRFTPKDFLIAAIQGIAINSIKIGFQVIGGNIVNALGHGGKLEGQLTRAIKNDANKIQPNPDGTFSTNTRRMGLIGSFLSRLTFDEVGGQWEHHEDPSKIAYTSERGLQAWEEAPWGSFVSFLARSRWFPLINPGSGFDLRKSERRPDQPHPAVEIIQNIRAAKLRKAR